MGKKLSLAGMIISIVGLVCYLVSYAVGFLAFIALPASIVGLVLSCVGGKKVKAAGGKSGMATAGLVVGIIATVLTGIQFACVLCVVCAAAAIA